MKMKNLIFIIILKLMWIRSKWQLSLLTKMNWNSFDLYSKLPNTIQTSNEIAQIG
jgi:hypothetical protein